MLDFLLGGGGKIFGLLGALLSLVGGALFFWKKAEKSGYQQKELENAKAQRENLEKIKRAQRARPTGSLSDDPHNRDNR